MDYERSERRDASRVIHNMRRFTELSQDLVLISVELLRPREPNLTTAEQAVVMLAAQGRSNRAIAECRGCSVATIAKQLASSYRKLAVTGRRELRAKLI